MLEFLASPFKAIYDLNVYLKSTKQSALTTLLFLVYLLALSSFLFFIVIIVRMPPLTPMLTEITEQVAQSIPNMEIKNGIMNANYGEYYEITPEGFGQKIVFDTSRTEPVYPTQLQQENIAVLVTAPKIYVAQQGQMQTYNLSKDLNITINGQTIISNQDQIVSYAKKIMMIALMLSMPIVVFVLMVVVMILTIIAFALSQLFANVKISFGDVISICCYLLAPVMFLLFLISIMPFNIPFVWLICFILLMIYSQFILAKMKVANLQEQKQIEEEVSEDEER